MRAVTTFSQKNYEDYAHRFLKSYVENWEIPLVCYVEKPVDFEHDLVEFRDFWEIRVPGDEPIEIYLNNLKRMGADGGEPYDYNKDVYKFCRKVFAQYDLLKTSKEKVFWLDADIETIAPVKEEFLEMLFDGHSLCYLGRNGFYTECGFVGFDMERAGMHDFLGTYTSLFTNGGIFNLKWWHDCAAFDFARQRHSLFGNNLSQFYEPGKGLHVFPSSVLGRVMKHNKGNRKYTS